MLVKMQRNQITHTTALKRIYNDRDPLKDSFGGFLKIKYATQEFHSWALILQKRKLMSTPEYTQNLHTQMFMAVLSVTEKNLVTMQLVPQQGND